MIVAKLTDAGELEPDELYKYVRLKSGEVRFSKLVVFGPVHRDMVEADEVVVSGGTIGVTPGAWTYVGYGSASCNAPWMPEDTDLLTALLNRPRA
jgi:hypothetical protein